MGKEKKFISLKYQIMGVVSAVVISIAVIFGLFSAFQTHKLSDAGIAKYDRRLMVDSKTKKNQKYNQGNL